MKRVSAPHLLQIDAIGGLITALSLGVGVPYFEIPLGLPLPLLRVMALIGLSFSIRAFIYSNHASGARAAHWLKRMAIANFAYCLFCAAILILHHNVITVWGCAYFALELAIILILARAEWTWRRR